MGYGDFMRVETTGASQQTANQDKLGYSGVRASETMAETDAGRMEKFRSIINRVGAEKGIAPALIAAIISRESRAGNALENGWGDFGKAWGLMQVDVTPNGGNHKKEGAWDSEEHLSQATGILVYFLQRISTKFPHWSPEQKLKGGIAAYNMGDGNVHSYENVDAHTTGKDYSNDVVARAKWYRNNKGFYRRVHRGTLCCSFDIPAVRRPTEEETSKMGYGDFMKVETTGASQQTANQDKLGYSGVRASETMAQTDAGRMEKFRSIINRVGAEKGIAPALIAAIISRESRAGNTIRGTGGWGDYDKIRKAYNAWGLMQIDVNPKGGKHKEEGAWDSEEHLSQATGRLVDFIGDISTKFDHWSPEQKLKGGIAAYNMGPGSVDSYAEVDAKTTGKDYSNDVVARAKWYRNNKGF
ncbi:SPbeta prophage-derived uncharacterized transglycosylase YomI-like [Tautogolabrus adspersus]